jgi:ribonuclease P/MRP protein subunit POP1
LCDSISENHWQLKKHVTIEENHVSQNTKSSILKTEEHFSSLAMLSLNVKDPRDLPAKKTVVSTEPISTKVLSDAQETSCEELADLGGMMEKNKDSTSLSDVDDLWYANTRGLKPPVEDSVLSMEKHCERMVKFCLDDINFGDTNSSKARCSRSCPILLLKNDMKELTMG